MVPTPKWNHAFVMFNNIGGTLSHTSNENIIRIYNNSHIWPTRYDLNFEKYNNLYNYIESLRKTMLFYDEIYKLASNKIMENKKIFTSGSNQQLIDYTGNELQTYDEKIIRDSINDKSYVCKRLLILHEQIMVNINNGIKFNANDV